jgi:hypothetical protein
VEQGEEGKKERRRRKRTLCFVCSRRSIQEEQRRNSLSFGKEDSLNKKCITIFYPRERVNDDALHNATENRITITRCCLQYTEAANGSQGKPLCGCSVAYVTTHKQMEHS